MYAASYYKKLFDYSITCLLQTLFPFKYVRHISWNSRWIFIVCFSAAEDEQKQKEPIKPVHETPLEDDDQKPPMNGTVEEKEYRETTNETGSTNDKESVKSEDETKTDGDKPVKEQKSDKELKKTIIKEDIIPSEVHLAVPLLSGDRSSTNI